MPRGSGPLAQQARLVDAAVGRRVRHRRIGMGISQQELAARLGLSFQQVQKYEKGLNRIGAGRLWQIAQALDVPVEWLFADA